MKKFIMISGFLLHLIVTKGQINDPNLTPFAYGISAGVFSSSARNNPPNISIINRKAVAGFSIGGVASFRKQKYQIETGINYMSEGYSYKYSSQNNKTINSVSSEYKFYSLMLPLKLLVPIHGTFVRHLPSVAFNLSLPIKQINFQTTEYNNAPLVKNVYNINADYKAITPSFSLGYGVEFEMDETLAIRFEPVCQFTFVNAKMSENKTVITNIGLKAYLLFIR